MAYDGRLVFDTGLDNKGIESDLNNLGNKLKTSLLAVGAAVAAGIGAAVKAGMDFEASMSKVEAISGATAADMDLLSEKAKQMGRDTAFSASQAGEAFQYMAMAGWKTEDMLNGIDGVMNLAAASGENLGLVSDIVTDALTAFGLQAKDSAHFADVLATASSNSNTNVAMMGATFKYVAPVAGAMKFSIEDTATAIGLMANAGIKGEQAGTTLRAVFTRLAKPPKEAADAIEALGISVTEANGDFKSLGKIMVDLRKKFANLTDEQKTQYAAMLGGQEAMSGLLSIVNASESDFDKLTEAISNADGAAEDMADTMMDNLKGQMTLLGSSLEGLGIAIYDGLEGPLKDAAKAAIESVNRITSSFQSGELKGAISKVGELLGNLITVIVNIASNVLPVLIKALAWLGDNLRTVGTIILATVAAIKTFSILSTIVSLVTKLTTAWHGASVALNLLTAAQAANANVSTLLATTLTAFQLIVGVLTGKVALATVAQIAWNTAKRMAIPIFGAVAAAITVLCVAIAKHKSEIDILIEAEKKELEQIKERRKAYDDLKQTQSEKAAADLAEIDNAERLWMELQTLTDKNGNVLDANKSRVSFILNELNSAFGLELELVGNTIKGYAGAADAIDKLIEKERAKALLDAQKPIYEENLANAQRLRNEQAEKGIEIENLENEIAAETIELNDLKEKSEKGLITMSGVAIATKEGELKKKQDMLDAEKSSYNELAEEVKENTQDMAGYEAARVLALEGKTQEAIDLLNAQNGGFRTAASVAGESATEQQRILSEQYAVALRVLEEYGANYNAGVEGYNAETLAMLGRNAEKCKAECEKAGKDIPDGLTTGINMRKPKLQTTLDTLFQSVPEWARKLLDMHSPSRVMRDEVGAMIVEGMAIGIRDNGGEVSEEFEKILDDLELKRDLAVIDESEYYRELERLRDNYLEKYTEKWWDVTKQLAQHDEQVRKTAMDKELNDLDWLLNTKEISEAEYYDRLAEYRDKYFEEDSEEWRQYTLKINSFRQKESDKARDKEFDQLKKQREYEQITEQQYYEQLAELRDKYFEEGTEEWEAYTDEIRKYNKSVVDELKNSIATVRDKLVGESSLVQEVIFKDQEGNITDSYLRPSPVDKSEIEKFRGLVEQIKELDLTDEGKAMVFDTINKGLDTSVAEANRIMEMLLETPVQALQELINAKLEVRKLSEDTAAEFVSLDDTKKAVNESVAAVKGGIGEIETEAKNSRERMEEQLRESLKNEMPELFREGGEASGEAFWGAFQAYLESAVAQVRNDLVAHMSANIPALATGGTGVTTANYSATYQFYGSGETTAQQLQAARNHATIERMRGL